MDLGQIGILLIGIGVLFFSIYLGMLFKETSEVIRETKVIVQRNSREIEDIIRDSSQILSAVGTVSSAVSSGSGFMGVAAKTAMSVAGMRRKRRRR